MRLSPLLALGLTLVCCTKPAAAPAAPAEPEAILIEAGEFKYLATVAP